MTRRGSTVIFVLSCFYFYVDDVQIKSIDDESLEWFNNGTDWSELPLSFELFHTYTRSIVNFYCDIVDRFLIKYR